jgi:transcriptional regulator with XRE-family HTH domain
MKLIEILAINLRYYRMKHNLSQEKFAEILGTSLSYLNQIENLKVNVRLATVDKFANNINKFDHSSKDYSNIIINL